MLPSFPPGLSTKSNTKQDAVIGATWHPAVVGVNTESPPRQPTVISNGAGRSFLPRSLLRIRRPAQRETALLLHFAYEAYIRRCHNFSHLNRFLQFPLGSAPSPSPKYRIGVVPNCFRNIDMNALGLL